jgi:uncharacterized protein YbaP (TraB family)
MNLVAAARCGTPIMFDRRAIAAAVALAALVLTIGVEPPRAAAEAQVGSCPPAAQAPTADQVQAGIRNARDRGFLWRIGKGGHSSYLYGTMHIARQDWIYPGENLRRALAVSDRIALEVDPLAADIRGRISAGLAAGNDTPLPEPLAGRMRVQAERACIPAEALNGMLPEMQIMTLEILAARADGLYADYASEAVLSGLARALNKPVVSLEAPELQLNLFRIENAQDRIAIVEKSLAHLESDRSRALTRRMAEMSAGGRLDELQRLREWCECADSEAEQRHLRRMLELRNPGLADGVAALHESGHTVFAAVGSLHMIDTMGVPGLPTVLARRGYQVEFVAFPP